MRKIFSRTAGDALMKTQVETTVGRFSLFQWEPSRFSFRFSEWESEVFTYKDNLSRTCPPVFSRWKLTFWKPQKVSVEYFLITSKGIKSYGHRFSGCLVEFSVKSGKHGTSTLEFGPKPGEIKGKPPKKYISLQLGVKLRNAPLFVPNWVSSGFDPSFLFPERLHCCYIHFHCSYMYNYYNYLEPCALNAEFKHFIPRFKTNFLTLRTSLKEGIRGEQRPKDRVKTGWL